MEENIACCKSPPLNEEAKSLVNRAKRTGGPYEVTEEEFTTLLEEGGRINGILDTEHEEGWKTQLWIEDSENGSKFYFFVYATAPGQWSKYVH